MKQEWFTAKEIAGLKGVPGTDSGVKRKAKNKDWTSRPRKAKGGGCEYHIDNLPKETLHALILRETAYVEPATPVEKPLSKSEIAEKIKQQDNKFTYDSAELWTYADSKPEKARAKGREKAGWLRQIMTLMESGSSFKEGAKLVGAEHGVSTGTLRGLYYGGKGKRGAKFYDMADWDVAMLPRFVGRVVNNKDCHPEAWDAFKGLYLTREQRTWTDCYRRLEEMLIEQNRLGKNWVIPSEKTLIRRLKKDVSIRTIVLKREGEEALNRLYPPQSRDRSCFAAGEGVSGDGMKFDKFWVDWGDDIINTTTGWFWQDLRSNKFLAYRIAKTENTDLFRLATYDLTALCMPSYIQVDNTRVAANKPMTGQGMGRHRFHTKDDDFEGVLIQLAGGDKRVVHFTDPNHKMSNAGVKPVERAFGIGGIHDAVRFHPKMAGRGISKKTAVPIAELEAIIAEEVIRFNARTKRRTDACRGVLSFNEAFDASFATAKVKTLTEAQRRLLLLMPERVFVNRTHGQVTLKAGASQWGKNHYWHEALNEFMGEYLTAYYDPENLEKEIALYGLDGRFIINAQHKPSTAFTDTSAGREHAKYKKRQRKADKISADSEVQMTNLQIANLYPKPKDVTIPKPGIVQGNFKQKKQVIDGELVDTETGEVLEADMEHSFGNVVNAAWENMKKPLLK